MKENVFYPNVIINVPLDIPKTLVEYEMSFYDQLIHNLIIAQCVWYNKYILVDGDIISRTISGVQFVVKDFYNNNRAPEIYNYNNNPGELGGL